MELVYLLAFACCILMTQAQVCPPTDVVFLLDLSENARRASTENSGNFGILKAAMRSFFNNPRIVNDESNFRFAIYGYSSGNGSVIIALPGANRIDALRSSENIGSNFVPAGSWTYTGLELITVPPTRASNRLIVVSSGGSLSPDRRSLAQNESSRVRSLGWDLYVLAVQGVNPFDIDELTIVSGGRPPVQVSDPATAASNSPKGYRALGDAFTIVINDVLCPQSLYSLCDNCLFSAGYGYDFDPLYCDSFYQCFPDADPIRKLCPAGTFWDGAQCNHINSVACPVAICDVTTPSGIRYKSGRCCNKYYECNNGNLKEESCPDGQVFDETTRSCLVPASLTAECEDKGRHQCDLNNGGASVVDCNGYAPDVTGDPCFFEFAGLRIRVPAGTIWDQNICSLTFTSTNFCLNNVNLLGRSLVNGTGPADVCNAVFRSNFQGGKREVFNERLDTPLDVFTILQEATLTDDCLAFTSSMINPFYYYFFFNNRDLREGTAFSVRFRLDNPQVGVVYDILSNNYCAQCPETITFTANAPVANRRSVTATFVTGAGNTVSTTAIMNNVDAGEFREMRVVYGVDTLSGVLISVNAAGIESQRVNFSTVSKTPGANIAINRCGIQLGRGPNNKFIGSICDFAVYEHCQDISTVLDG